MNKRFYKKAILITGDGSGIGCDTSLLLASEGAHVLISDIDAQSGERTTGMVKNYGCIVNMSSVASLYGNRYVGPAYIASKHGVVGLTKSAAIEYACEGIRVNAVCPESSSLQS